MDTRFAFEVGTTLCFQITIVVATTFALQRWVIDSRLSCRLWTTCFVSIIALVAAAFLLPHRRLFPFPSGVSRESVLNLVVWQGRIVVGFLMVWGLGIVFSIIKRAVLCFGLFRFLKFGCDAIDHTALLQRAGIGANNLPNLAILTSSEIRGPFCWQLQKPVIVLPTSLLDEDETTLRHVLAHELEHLRTQHPMQHFLQGVCSTLFWFHPLVWSAARGAELTREFLCDEVAARTTGKFSAYLRTLAKVAEQCNGGSCTDVPAGTLAFGNRRSALVRRSENLVKLAKADQKPNRFRAVVGIGMLVLASISIQQIWIPTNALASGRSEWSPWPTWTATALHHFNLHVRDFERFEDRTQLHEWIAEDN
ncbi:M56 family metallopeptidase [Neorhodopirellula lusitana]|uniref:M56 family metallopeptidase n=1 Tax=Neorhodopirellula lusitana TaxID=445327 RepID=UPI00384C0C21